MTATDFSCQEKLSQQQKQKVVRFDLESVVQHDAVECEAGGNSDYKSLKWYNQEELDCMMVDSNEALNLKKKGEKHPEQFGHSYRGLEDREQEEYNTKKQILSLAQRAHNAVMQAQERQRSQPQTGDDSRSPEEVLATIYAGYTVLCANAAARRGEEDRQEARDQKPDSDSGNGNNDNNYNNFIFAGLEMEFQIAGSTVDYDDDDDSSVVSDVSIDPCLGSSNSGSRMIGRIRKMMDRTTPFPNPRTSVV